jgi:SAM-dependent methyltransferase
MPMKLRQDAYGDQLLAQFLRKAEENEIIERDDGYIGTGSNPGDYFNGYPKWSVVERKAIKLAKGKVLDIGAGAGRHSLYLQKRGNDVTPIDNSPGAVKVCRLRGLKKALVVPIEKIRRFKPGSFDTIIMLGNNFGLFGSPAKAKKILKWMRTITSARAQIIAQSRDPYKTADENHLEYHALNRRRGRMPGQLRIRVRFKKAVGPWFDYLFVSQGEMKNIVNNSGWKIKRFIASPRSANYIAVLVKK